MSFDPRLNELARIAAEVRYEPDTGLFFATVTKRGWPAGRRVGGADAKGYVVIKNGDTVVKAHRLAWFMVYGELPDLIDHINGDPSDNRIGNLRPASRRANALNAAKMRGVQTRSGLRGVTKISGRSKKWAARISRDGRKIHLGSFATPEEAHARYLQEQQSMLREALHAN